MSDWNVDAAPSPAPPRATTHVFWPDGSETVGEYVRADIADAMLEVLEEVDLEMGRSPDWDGSSLHYDVREVILKARGGGE